MEQAVWLASIFGPILIVISLWVLLKTHEVDRLWTSVKATPAAYYLGAFLNLLIGFTILSLYNRWSIELAVLVTLLGYLQTIRGIVALFYHDKMIKWSQKLINNPHFRSMSAIPLVYGLLLFWLGFFA